jgi:regulator of RNase E activity RraA
MESTLVDRFFAEEFTERDRAKFLEELATRSSGKRRFNFNVFDVVINVDSGTVTVEDILDADSTGTVNIPIDEFAARVRTAVVTRE